MTIREARGVKSAKTYPVPQSFLSLYILTRLTSNHSSLAICLINLG